MEAEDWYLNSLNIPRVSDINKYSMDRVVDTDEIITAIKQMKPNKVPWTDGLPIEFYRCFETKIISTSLY